MGPKSVCMGWRGEKWEEGERGAACAKQTLGNRISADHRVWEGQGTGHTVSQSYVPVSHQCPSAPNSRVSSSVNPALSANHVCLCPSPTGPRGQEGKGSSFMYPKPLEQSLAHSRSSETFIGDLGMANDGQRPPQPFLTLTFCRPRTILTLGRWGWAGERLRASPQSPGAFGGF